MATVDDIMRRLKHLIEEGCHNPNHDADIERGSCGSCGETKSVSIRSGDYATFLFDEEGRVVAALLGASGSVIRVLDYPKAREMVEKWQQ